MSHATLPNPRMKKDLCQPADCTRNAMAGTPRARPARVPQFMRPEARPRSCGPKRTLTIFMPPGRYTDSPIPRIMRIDMSAARLPANPVKPQASDQSAKAAAVKPA